MIERTRTFQWQDPMVGAQAAKGMSGLEYLQAMQRGEFPPPPIMAPLAFGFVGAEEGRVLFKLTPAEFHYNPIGSVHGGVFCTLLDSAMGCAVHSALPAGAGYTTLELKVNLLRPLTAETGEVLCEGKTVYVGGRQTTAEGRIYGADGKLYAHGTTTCMVFR
ncbi:MAG: aromatic compound degradation protein PaaI [Meiothermus sp.]